MKEEQIKKNIHFLKIYKRFIKGMLWGFMTFEQVENIAQKTWKLEKKLKKDEN